MSSTQRRNKKLTNHNTDVMCRDAKTDSWLQTTIYRIHLWTGLYMLNAWERAAFQIFGCISGLAFLLYVGVFVSGVIEGIRQAAGDVADDGTASEL
mmetsp:Transcript_20068/g.55845  ORF Transcript_20068/g.55845 Transcript_20068/m.55845 type:complete len:96 (+) Transcript_20068:297-584(+)